MSLVLSRTLLSSQNRSCKCKAVEYAGQLFSNNRGNMTHFFKYAWDQQNNEWFVDREIKQDQYEQSYLQYWNRIRKGLGR